MNLFKKVNKSVLIWNLLGRIRKPFIKWFPKCGNNLKKRAISLKVTIVTVSFSATRAFYQKALIFFQQITIQLYSHFLFLRVSLCLGFFLSSFFPYRSSEGLNTSSVIFMFLWCWTAGVPSRPSGGWGRLCWPLCWHWRLIHTICDLSFTQCPLRGWKDEYSHAVCVFVTVGDQTVMCSICIYLTHYVMMGNSSCVIL